jgi:DNA-binding MarR family transcriptional regulator
VHDSVDQIVAEWAAERSDLPVAPLEVITRLSRVRSRIGEEIATVFLRHHLSEPDFTVMAALRRAGAPFTLPQSVLMERLHLTSGTVSVRLSRLEAKGIVTRRPSEQDGRGVLVTLTDEGAAVFDRVAPEHLANEDVLLSALTDDERTQLAGLLRKLLVGFEHATAHSPFGFTVAPAHTARRARTAVGLSDRAGLLVESVDADSAAATGGLRAGDLLIEAGTTPLRSCVDLGMVSRGAVAIRLRILRGEQERELLLTREQRP